VPSWYNPGAVPTLVEALAQTFLPASCSICGSALPWRGSRAGVCPVCWDGATPHTGPLCPSCGTPELVDGGACLTCRTAPPPWRAAASFGPYAGVLRELILLFKGRGRDELAAPLAGLLIGALRRAAWPAPDAVVAVPMTWVRRLRRGYNQAELLAHEVARTLGVRRVRALRRRGRGTQVGGARSERLRLAASAFPVRRAVRGRVVLVDDVFTTGATAAACTRALRRAGADEVLVLTLARTPQPGRIP
jgi:ComF family protein